MTIIWAGLAVGAIYTLVAVGYNITLTNSGVFNFAQGQIMVFATFFAWFTIVDQGWAWWIAAPVGAVACGLIGLAEDLIAIRPIINRHGGHAALVTTVGVSVVIEGLLMPTWGKTPKSVAFFGGTKTLTLWGGRVDPVDLWLIGAAVVCALAMHLVMRYTPWGVAGRAAHDDGVAAMAKGVNVTALRTTAFVLAGAIAGLLGPVLAPKLGADLSTGITLTIFGFVALAFGGFGSYVGCLVGGISVGLIQAYSSRYLGVDYPPLILFGVLLATLLLKPSGLLGQRRLRVV